MSLNSEISCPNKMREFWIIILVAFIATNSLDKAESVKLELKTFDEIFGEGWWDNCEAEDLKTPAPTNFGQNVHYQIDRQNTQIGQIEPNSTDQNPPLTKSSNENIAENERKCKIIAEFHAIKEELKQKSKFPWKARIQIEEKIANHLKVSRSKIYKWKKEFGLSQRNPKNERQNLVEKFDQMKAELTRAGFKNSYKKEIDQTVAKELGISDTTIYRWKSELGQTTPKHKHSHNEQKELMKLYYEIKSQTPIIKDTDIAKMLKIGRDTLRRWKKQFNRQQLHPNSVDSVEKNAAANVQEIESI